MTNVEFTIGFFFAVIRIVCCAKEQFLIRINDGLRKWYFLWNINIRYLMNELKFLKNIIFTWACVGIKLIIWLPDSGRHCSLALHLPTPPDGKSQNLFSGLFSHGFVQPVDCVLSMQMPSALQAPLISKSIMQLAPQPFPTQASFSSPIKVNVKIHNPKW